jgi:hypothetical protein
VFIVAAAATGVFVGTRPTVMDGRWIAAKLTKAGQEVPGTIECEREIRVGVAGAEFACVRTRNGAREQVWYRMARDGKVELVRVGRPGHPARGAL